MPQIKIGDTVLSFDNTTGKMVVLRTDGVCNWTGEPFYLSEFARRVLYVVALFVDIAVCGYVQKQKYFLILKTSC